MRQVVLDTETTGLEPEQGHRVIEIGCVELVNRRKTGRKFHRYLRPDRLIDRAAQHVHGITDDFLAQQPRFADVVDELIEFVNGAELVIHNAAFDIAFLDAELQRLPGPARRMRDLCSVIDTLPLARQMHPGQRNSLDALCKRYSVDNSHRELHGALLDAQILLDVYLAMTGGQTALVLGEVTEIHVSVSYEQATAARPRGVLRVVRASDDELVAHERILQIIDKLSEGKTVWRREADSGWRIADSPEASSQPAAPAFA
jgi:DNA polymerase-3 subunit epsilon